MDKQLIIDFIIEEYGQVTDELRAQLDALLLRLFNYKGELTAVILMEWSESDLSLLYNTLSGVRLTRNYVPDINSVYASMDSEQLPSSVSFGRIQDDEGIDLKPRIHRQYGKYEVPPTINRLYELGDELGRAMDLELGLRMHKYDFRYHCTPPDFIPFASPGVDGIHYCFVTDFGAVDDLEQAYIAVVSPMNFDSEIWLVAKNITDFLRVLCTDRNILYNNFKTVDAYLKSVKEQEVEMKEQMSKPVLQRLKEVFGLGGIPDMVDYMRSVREDRCQAICIQTLDTVGIVPLSCQTNQAAAEPLSIDWDDERGLDVLLQEASTETKLAIIRDAQHKKRIPDERMMLWRCKNILTELGLHHELYNLMEITD